MAKAFFFTKKSPEKLPLAKENIDKVKGLLEKARADMKGKKTRIQRVTETVEVDDDEEEKVEEVQNGSSNISKPA